MYNLSMYSVYIDGVKGDWRAFNFNTGSEVVVAAGTYSTISDMKTALSDNSMTCYWGKNYWSNQNLNDLAWWGYDSGIRFVHSILSTSPLKYDWLIEFDLSSADGTEFKQGRTILFEFIHVSDSSKNLSFELSVNQPATISTAWSTNVPITIRNIGNKVIDIYDPQDQSSNVTILNN